MLTEVEEVPLGTVTSLGAAFGRLRERVKLVWRWRLSWGGVGGQAVVVSVADDPVGLWCVELAHKPAHELGGGGRHGNRGLWPLSTRNRLQICLPSSRPTVAGSPFGGPVPGVSGDTVRLVVAARSW